MSDASLERDPLDRAARLRSQTRGDVQELTAAAKQAAKPQFYLRRYPKTVIGGALLAGYLLVPSRPRIVSPKPEDLAKLAKTNRIVVTEKPKAGRSASLANQAATMLAMAVARAGMAWVGEKFGGAAAEADQARPVAPSTAAPYSAGRVPS